jgi:hypothetical protein
MTLGCNTITGGSDQIIAIEIDGGLKRTVEEGDSLQLVARALTTAGDTVSDATIIWQVLDVDTDSSTVGFTLDSLTGLLVAHAPGWGRVRPRVEEVTPLEPIEVGVTPAPDSVSADGDQALTMAAEDATSPALTTVLHDLTTEPDTVVPLPSKPVHFHLMNPAPGTPESSGFFFVPTAQDTTSSGEVHTLVATTDQSGRARVFIRRATGGVLPDSAVVNAMAFTATGDTVRGSPVRFVVVFDNNSSAVARFAGGTK